MAQQNLRLSSEMGRKEIRRYFVVYHSLGPLLVAALVFLAFFWVLSLFYNGTQAEKMRGVGLIFFAVLFLLGLFRGAVVFWKTRGLD
jgi:hypothetical protein